MGGQGSGRRPDPQKREQARRLRARGLSPAQIAKALGCSRQAVANMLQDPFVIRCRSCRAEVCPAARKGMWLGRGVLCLACLAKAPDAPFEERLRALRLARGLIQAQLAELAGVPHQAVMDHEKPGRGLGRWDVLRKLARVLGPALVGLG
jgi:transcriptional regulator with XRE-family HTH domain